MKIERKHLKAILADPDIRKDMLVRMDKENLISAEIDSLLAQCDFDALCAVAWEALHEAYPIVKTYSITGGDGEEYDIQIVGVPGAYFVATLDYDDAGMFGTLRAAEDYIGCNWFGEARESTD